ncbi:ABC transporter substrate-binding protein [Paenibacillus eucommiae]|uniref:MarR-like DNA-binding transcriptional regulator SgrR of sgrS sRNA n=1 Tax=Paenibacillus eucommiae TaxID=1355755 RepID=A0ABS4IS78_9BACL|nr:ABC transporter substrate-binding protein [Paenibacillus eucommiae]MBP1990413.1 MarR-like DNA-binding transcriptional regulator SgrR of sgrS sRNA [Paenibacillus eucommiae]
MKIRRHYLTLRRAFPQIAEEVPLEITVQELSQLLDCTHRNMVLLLKRMEQEQWLSWTPRRGRGNRSVLLFLARKEEMVLQEAQEMVGKQDLRSALELVHAGEDASSAREQFHDWLSGQFGFRSEVQGQRRSDILRFPLPQTIHSLDPVAIHYSGESHLVNQLFDGLVRMDAKGEAILPHLAHAWEVDAARTTWTFYLRKGVLFHHGREMLASDVKYSLERLQRLAPRGLYSWAYACIQAIETPNDTTVSIHLSERNEAFLAFLTTNRASIVPQDACEAGAERFGRMPVGTGPFRLIGHEQGIWTLEAFAAYFQGRGFLDRVEVWTMPERDAKQGGHQTGKQDGQQNENQNGNKDSKEHEHFQVMHNVRISELGAERWQQVRQSGMTCKFITVNELKGGPTANPEIRKAIHSAIDRAYLLELLSGDVIEAGDSFWPEEADAVSDTVSELSGLPVLPDLKEVKRNLLASGYGGETLKLATIPQYESDAQIIAQVCARAGILLEIELIPAEQFKGKARMDADLLLFAVMLDEHRELRLIDLYKSMQEHAAPEVQAMLDLTIRRLLMEPDAKCRSSLFREIETQLKNRHSLLFLYHKHLKTAYHPSIRGISLDSLGWVRFRDIWFT